MSKKITYFFKHSRICSTMKQGLGRSHTTEQQGHREDCKSRKGTLEGGQELSSSYLHEEGMLHGHPRFTHGVWWDKQTACIIPSYPQPGPVYLKQPSVFTLSSLSGWRRQQVKEGGCDIPTVPLKNNSVFSRSHCSVAS